MARIYVAVLAHANVMGLTAGSHYDLQPTEELEFYARTGHVEILDDLGPHLTVDVEVDDGER